MRNKSTIFVRDLESGRETPLFDGLDRDMQETWAVHGVYPSMAWTPDSKSIVFWSAGGIHRLDAASKQVTDIPFHVKGTRRVQEAVRVPIDVAPANFDVKMLALERECRRAAIRSSIRRSAISTFAICRTARRAA